MKQDKAINYILKAAKELGAEKKPISVDSIVKKTQEIMKEKRSSRESLAASLYFYTINMQSRFPDPRNPKKKAPWMLEPYFVREKGSMYRLLNELEKENVKKAVDRNLDIIYSSEYSIEELNTTLELDDTKYWFIFVNTKNSKIVEFRAGENNISLCDMEYDNPNNWDVLGDLSSFINNYDSYFEHYKNVYPKMDSRSQSQKSKELWNFITMRNGDMVIASSKTIEIVGVGIVNGSYIFNEDEEKFKHLIPINWINKQKIKLPNDFRDYINITQTIQSITKEEYEKLIGKKDIDIYKENYSILGLIKKKKQIILYGPPGTGKTYNTKKITIDFINKE